MVLAQEKLRYDQPAVELPRSGKVIKRKIRKVNTSKQAKILAVSLVVLAFAAGIFVAAQYAGLAQKNYQLAQVKKDIAVMQVDNQKLQLQIGELRSVGRIESIAVNQLGMVKPAKFAYLDYQVEQKAKVPSVGAVTTGQSQAVAPQSAGNPVIRQVANLLSGLFGSAQR